MTIYSRYVFLLAFGFFISLSLPMHAVATIEFYLLTNDAKQKVDCDFLEINNNQALCTVNELLITYELSRVKAIEVVDKGMSSNFQLFTQETRKTINDINSNKKHSKKENRPANSKQIILGSKKIGIDSFSGFTQRLISYFKHPGGNTTFSTILSISGLIIFLIGSLGFLIATFRTGILWGLSCMFLPLVSFIFLFVHWKTAAKPFFLTLLGMAFLFLGTFFAPIGLNTQNIAKSETTTALDNKRKKNGRFQCSGKIYCSEMSSCAEAKFYLRNCPGTKMDGNNDGIPCEKQWCSN